MTHETIRAPSHDSRLARAVAAFCAEQRFEEPADLQRPFPGDPRWGAVREAGSARWLDSGDLEACAGIWAAELSGLTTNNSLLNNEVQKGTYDELVARAAQRLRAEDAELDEADLVHEIGFVLNVVHALRLVRAFDADVNVELHTALAGDAEGSYEYGRRIAAVCPDRFIVKVPCSPEGLIAARRLEEFGVRVNVTLGFSARQNHLIARYARPHFVNVFLGRVTAFAGGIGMNESWARIGEIAALASQREIRSLVRAGAASDHTRQIAASMRGGDQVAELAGIDVLTMPVAAAREFTSGKHAPGSLRDRTDVDPVAQLAEPPVDLRLDVLWKVDDAVVAAAGQLLLRPVETMTGHRVQAVLKDNYLGDLFPELTGSERERIAADGKVPDLETWRSRVQDRTASWDGLLNAAGLAAFARDQAALDDRIRQCM